MPITLSLPTLSIFSFQEITNIIEILYFNFHFLSLWGQATFHGLSATCISVFITFWEAIFKKIWPSLRNIKYCGDRLTKKSSDFYFGRVCFLYADATGIEFWVEGSNLKIQHQAMALVSLVGFSALMAMHMGTTWTSEKKKYKKMINQTQSRPFPDLTQN